MLRAHELPPHGHGGNTDFADTRTACNDLPHELREELKNEYIGAHSLMHSRKKAAPKDSQWLCDVNPEDYPFGRHAILQTHEGSGRQNLYIANHLHHLEYAKPKSPDFVATKEQPFERLPETESTQLIEALLEHATQPKYIVSVEWQQPGDLVAWDNTCVMHRAGEGTFMGKYKVNIAMFVDCITSDNSIA